MRLLSEVNRRARNSGAGPSRGGRGGAGGSGGSSARQPRIDLNTLRAAMARASNALGQPPPTVRLLHEHLLSSSWKLRNFNF